MSIYKVRFQNCRGPVLPGFAKKNKIPCLLFIGMKRHIYLLLTVHLGSTLCISYSTSDGCTLRATAALALKLDLVDRLWKATSYFSFLEGYSIEVFFVEPMIFVRTWVYLSMFWVVVYKGWNHLSFCATVGNKYN